MVQSFATMVINATFAWMIGALASRAWLQQDGDAMRSTVRAKLSSSLGVALWLCIAASLLSLWQAAATMGDVQLVETTMPLLKAFAMTQYAFSAFAGIGLLVLVVVVLIAEFKGALGGRHRWLVAGLLGVHAASRVTLGHAFEQGPVSVAVMVEWTHLILMALWVGTVMTAAWIVLPHLASDAATKQLLSTYLASVSTWATVALAGIVITGLFNTFRVLAHPADLVTTDYGAVLTTKLALVAIAIGLGAYNRFVGFPKASGSWRSTEGADPSPATVILRIESVVLLLVLGAAAILTGSAPPGMT